MQKYEKTAHAYPQENPVAQEYARYAYGSSSSEYMALDTMRIIYTAIIAVIGVSGMIGMIVLLVGVVRQWKYFFYCKREKKQGAIEQPLIYAVAQPSGYVLQQ